MTWTVWGGVALATLVVTGLVWLIWGFRWPPSAVVALDEKPTSAYVER